MTPGPELGLILSWHTEQTADDRDREREGQHVDQVEAAAEDPGDTQELAVYLEFFAALLRAPDALQRYSSGRERRLQELADADDADSDELAAGVTPVQAWTIGQAMLVGLQIEKRLAPGLVTPEVFERAFGLLAGLYREQ
jgi:hypothetical protein